MTPEQLARAKLANKVPKSSKSIIRVENKASGATDVYLYDEIGPFGITATAFQQAMGQVNSQTVNLYVNSVGGDVFDGLAIMNQLQRERSNGRTVNVIVDGLAASAASFIAMAGDTVTMGAQSQLMVHDASGLVIGNAADMSEMAAFLDKQSDNIASIYAGRAGGTTDQWRAVMQAETWFSAQEAVDAGLADTVDGSVADENPETTNRFDLSIFAHAGRSQAPTPAPVHARGMSAHHPPAEPEDKNTPTEGDIVNDALKSALIDRLGVTAPVDQVTDEMLQANVVGTLDEKDAEIAKLREQLAEAEKPAGDSKDGEPDLPEGTIPVSAAVFEQLQADAQAGRAAKEELDEQRRASKVENAVREGRIAPADRETWMQQMRNSEDVASNLLNLMPKSGVVNVAEKGFTGGGVDDKHEATDAYPAHWIKN